MGITIFVKDSSKRVADIIDVIFLDKKDPLFKLILGVKSREICLSPVEKLESRYYGQENVGFAFRSPLSLAPFKPALLFTIRIGKDKDTFDVNDKDPLYPYLVKKTVEQDLLCSREEQQ